MELDTMVMASSLQILNLGMINARVIALRQATAMRQPLQPKMATLLPMAPKVRLVKHHHLGNLNRDTWGDSLALTLHTQLTVLLNLVMECLQPHNPVMGLHL